MKFQSAVKLRVRSVNAPTIILSVEKTESDNQEHSSVRSSFSTLQSGDADVFLCSDRERGVVRRPKYKMDHTTGHKLANREGDGGVGGAECGQFSVEQQRQQQEGRRAFTEAPRVAASS